MLGAVLNAVCHGENSRFQVRIARLDAFEARNVAGESATWARSIDDGLCCKGDGVVPLGNLDVPARFSPFQLVDKGVKVAFHPVILGGIGYDFLKDKKGQSLVLSGLLGVDILTDTKPFENYKYVDGFKFMKFEEEQDIINKKN